MEYRGRVLRNESGQAVSPRLSTACILFWQFVTCECSLLYMPLPTMPLQWPDPFGPLPGLPLAPRVPFLYGGDDQTYVIGCKGLSWWAVACWAELLLLTLRLRIAQDRDRDLGISIDFGVNG
jgi:hypothetical protein